ncbi:uncharacterized protein METZ01_LOCUS344981, partial [marine metagenome]
DFGNVGTQKGRVYPLYSLNTVCGVNTLDFGNVGTQKGRVYPLYSLIFEVES